MTSQHTAELFIGVAEGMPLGAATRTATGLLLAITPMAELNLESFYPTGQERNEIAELLETAGKAWAGLPEISKRVLTAGLILVAAATRTGQFNSNHATIINHLAAILQSETEKGVRSGQRNLP